MAHVNYKLSWEIALISGEIVARKHFVVEVLIHFYHKYNINMIQRLAQLYLNSLDILNIKCYK